MQEENMMDQYADGPCLIRDHDIYEKEKQGKLRVKSWDLGFMQEEI